MRVRVPGAAAVVLALLAPPPASPQEAAEESGSGRQAFVGATILPMDGEPIENGVVLVRYGRITSVGAEWAGEIPEDAERIDLSGRFVMPGMINAHGHVGGVRGLESGAELHTEEIVTDQLERYARYGVTSVFSLGDDRGPGLREAAARERGEAARARIYAAGPVVTGTTPVEVRRGVDLAEAMGADLIKIRVDDQHDTIEKMSPPIYATVIERAHEHGLRVAAHVYELEDAIGLLEAGVDLLAHSIRDRPVDERVIALLQERQICVCPTLTREVSIFAYAETPDFFADPFFLGEVDPAVVDALRDPERQRRLRADPATEQARRDLEMAQANLKALVDAGVRIAMGTDTGPPARFQGYFEHLELELMQQAGLGIEQVLLAATVDAALCTGEAGRIGTLAPGAWADLLVLDADPREDLRNLRRIHSVWVSGRRVAERP